MTGSVNASPGAAGDAGRGFLFDLNRCTGCHACELACATENELPWGTSWRQVVTMNPDREPSIPSYHLSLACNHCRDAPCRRHCPALAIDRDAGTGAVLIDAGKCIGCTYCSWACPYDAPRFDTGAGVMGKCTWCRPRLAEGRDPACVEQCPTGALGFGTLEGETVVPGFPDTPARPAIRFTPLRGGLRVPETTWQPPPGLESFTAARPERGPRIALRTEWPLCLFTLLVSGLAGWVLGALGRAAMPPLPVFLAVAGLAAAASTLHLGRRDRMWRAMLNVRRSWLSREIVFFGAFSGATVLHLLLPDLPGVKTAAAVLGAATLFSIDRVYDLVRPSRHRLHSADTVLTGALLAFLLGGAPGAAAAVAAVKGFLYVAGVRGNPAGMGAAAAHGLRLAGLALAAAAGFGSGSIPVWVWLLLVLAEVIDRVRFYRGLRVVSPHRQTAADLALARSRSK